MKHANLGQMLLSFVVLFGFILGCSKEDGEFSPNAPSQEPEEPPIEIPVDENDAVLREDVILIDSSLLDLQSDSVEFEQGIYKFSVSEGAPEIVVGSVIVGEQGGGFLRRVTSISSNEETVELLTTQATLEELFESASIQLDLQLSNADQVKSSKIDYQLFNLDLLNRNGVRVYLDGSLSFQSGYDVQLAYGEEGLQRFSLQSKDAVLKGIVELGLISEHTFQLPELDRTLAKFRRKGVLKIPAGGILIPVVYEIEADVFLKSAASIKEATNASISLVNENKLDLELRYQDDEWTHDIRSTTDNDLLWEPLNSAIEGTLDLELGVKVRIKFYQVLTPYLSGSLREQLRGRAVLPSGDWDFEAMTWGNGTIGARAEILGLELFDVFLSEDTDTLRYRTPYELRKVDGDEQTGRFDLPLANPIKVQVLDEFNRPQAAVPVQFTVKSGGGEVSSKTVFSDEKGYAEVTWTLGATQNQELEVNVMKGDRRYLMNQPLVFSATASAVKLKRIHRGGTLYGNTNSSVFELVYDEADNIGTVHWYVPYIALEYQEGRILRQKYFMRSSGYCGYFGGGTDPNQQFCTSFDFQYNQDGTVSAFTQRNYNEDGVETLRYACSYAGEKLVELKHLDRRWVNTFQYDSRGNIIEIRNTNEYQPNKYFSSIRTYNYEAGANPFAALKVWFSPVFHETIEFDVVGMVLVANRQYSPDRISKIVSSSISDQEGYPNGEIEGVITLSYEDNQLGLVEKVILQGDLPNYDEGFYLLEYE